MLPYLFVGGPNKLENLTTTQSIIVKIYENIFFRHFKGKSMVNLYTGGPPLTRKSLTRFTLTRFLAYVRVSGGISVSRGPQYSPTNTSFM